MLLYDIICSAESLENINKVVPPRGIDGLPLFDKLLHGVVKINLRRVK